MNREWPLLARALAENWDLGSIAWRWNSTENPIFGHVARGIRAFLCDGEKRGRPAGRGRMGPVAPKYRNPENPSEAWAGRGLSRVG
jgi:hypothetical protein